MDIALENYRLITAKAAPDDSQNGDKNSMADIEFTAAPTLRVAAPKPKMTVYYALLIIALCAMLTACLFMYLEIRRFGGFGAVKGTVKTSLLERPSHVALANECNRTVASLT